MELVFGATGNRFNGDKLKDDVVVQHLLPADSLA